MTCPTSSPAAVTALGEPRRRARRPRITIAEDEILIVAEDKLIWIPGQDVVWLERDFAAASGHVYHEGRYAEARGVAA